MVINRVPELVVAKFGSVDKVNLSEVQRDTGLQYTTVSRWMKNRIDRADFPVLEVWCRYLGVGIGELLVYKSD